MTGLTLVWTSNFSQKKYVSSGNATPRDLSTPILDASGRPRGEAGQVLETNSGVFPYAPERHRDYSSVLKTL